MFKFNMTKTLDNEVNVCKIIPVSKNVFFLLPQQANVISLCGHLLRNTLLYISTC